MFIKKIILTGMIVILTLFISALEKAPDFKLENMKGKQVKLSHFLEEGLVILDFWATWCVPCKKALPELNRIHQEYDSVNVVTVCTDKPRKTDKAKSFIKSNKYKFKTLFDPGKKVRNLYKVTNIPRTFLIAPDGTILYDHLGYNKGDEKHLEEEIRKWFAHQTIEDPLKINKSEDLSEDEEDGLDNDDDDINDQEDEIEQVESNE